MTAPVSVLDPTDPRPSVRAALNDWLALQLALGLDPRNAAARLRSQGDARAALAADPPVSRPAAERVRAAAAGLRRVGGVAVPLLSTAYPGFLAQLEDPAPLLLVRGDPGALTLPAIAMVGARAATATGRAVAREFACHFAAAGFVVVSGLARGIDAAAHRGALDARGLTVAVQACGLDRVYPPEHRRLAGEIARRGAVVTEFALGSPPRSAHFPLRNRLISGLACALVVVEARERSGSLLTAAHAADQGIDVFAVPGPLTAPTSRGTNRLLRDGAHVAIEPGDVLSFLEISGVRPAPNLAAAGTKIGAGEGTRRAAGPGRRGRRILGLLRAEPATRDELTRRLEVAPEQLALDLLELELAGLVQEDRDGRLHVLQR